MNKDSFPMLAYITSLFEDEGVAAAQRWIDGLSPAGREGLKDEVRRYMGTLDKDQIDNFRRMLHAKEN